MTSRIAFVFLTATVMLPTAAHAQGGFGGRSVAFAETKAPKLPIVELAGPLDSALARVKLSLTDAQATRYAQVYDSFMVATRPQRDSARGALQKMNDKLDVGDRPAALFYAERVQELGKFLKARQDRFEGALRAWLSKDQVKAYQGWRESEEQAGELKRREEALRWQEAAFNADFGPRTAFAAERKTVVATPAGVPNPALGSQVVRLGSTLYVAGQLGVDSAGILAGNDLRAQAARAFANLSAVLQAVGATPRDVVTLTIYVVNYGASDLSTIREAGAAYFGSNAPIATVLGVAALGGVGEGALISIAATATASTARAR